MLDVRPVAGVGELPEHRAAEDLRRLGGLAPGEGRREGRDALEIVG
jgi:hypothetical protein